MRDKLQKSEVRLKEETEQRHELQQVKERVTSLNEKLKVNFGPIESTLSCLSCLSFLSEPNPCTLICGHAICRTCFNEHSVPTSAESVILCEECKIETKNC